MGAVLFSCRLKEANSKLQPVATCTECVCNTHSVRIPHTLRQKSTVPFMGAVLFSCGLKEANSKLQPVATCTECVCNTHSVGIPHTLRQKSTSQKMKCAFDKRNRFTSSGSADLHNHKMCRIRTCAACKRCNGKCSRVAGRISNGQNRVCHNSRDDSICLSAKV